MEDAAVILQKYVRLKAADENGYCTCVTCKKVSHWKELQGGHFIKRKHISTKLMEENVHPQCGYCNGHLRGNDILYTLYMVDMYGREFVDDLIQKKYETTYYTKTDACDWLEEWKEKWRILSEERKELL